MSRHNVRSVPLIQLDGDCVITTFKTLCWMFLGPAIWINGFAFKTVKRLIWKAAILPLLSGRVERRLLLEEHSTQTGKRDRCRKFFLGPFSYSLEREIVAASSFFSLMVIVWSLLLKQLKGSFENSNIAILSGRVERRLLLEEHSTFLIHLKEIERDRCNRFF